MNRRERNKFLALALRAHTVKCEICRDPFKAIKEIKVDHDHRTGKIRGLLCHRCNVAIGLLRDRTAFMLHAQHYLALERTKQPRERTGLFTLHQVAAIIKLPEKQIWKLVRAGVFPKPRNVIMPMATWRRDQIAEWLHTWEKSALDIRVGNIENEDVGFDDLLSKDSE